MIIYLFILFITLLFSVVFDKSLNKNNLFTPLFIVYIIVVFYVGFRYRVGIDTLNYIEVYNRLPNIDNIKSIFDSEENYSIRPLFLLLVVVSKLFSSDFYLFQIIHAAILNFIIFYFIFKESDRPFFGIAIYLITYFFYFNMEIMKESLAVGMFILSRNSILQKKWINYYLFVFLATLFHYSAIILVFFPLFIKLRMNKQLVILCFIVLFAYVELKPVINSFLLSLDSSLLVNKIINFMDYSEQDFSYKTFVFQVTIYSILPLSILYLYNKISLNKYRFEFLVVLQVLLGIGVIFYQTIFSRFTNYTQPFCFLLYALYIYKVFTTKYIRNKICMLGVVFIVSVTFIDYTIRPIVGAHKYNQWFPYYSIFDQKRDEVREKIWMQKFE